MSNLMKKMMDSKVSRRSFLKGSAALAGVLATGASLKMTEAAAEEAQVTNPEEGGTWVAAACWHNCGGRCVNKVMVKDGAVVRQKSDDSHPDSYEYPQQRSCLRGHSQQQQCFGVDRIRYPMKRKNWSPENPNGHLRGVDEWERISWEEAIKYTADQIMHNINTYGPANSILVPGYASHYGTAQAIKLVGGHINETCTSSTGSYHTNITAYGLNNANAAAGRGTLNDRFDLPNAEWISMTGSNPAWSALGSQMNNFLHAKEKGTKFIYIGPNYNATAQALDAKWIVLRPGTDTAFLLAVAYEMLRLEETEGSIIDWDFLYKYTVGFDEAHLPADATLTEGFAEYVKGKYDNVPKTPEWASEICGTPVEDITWYARILGKNTKVMVMNTYAPARNRGAENYPQIAMTIGLMGGHIGKPGHATGISYHRWAGNDGPTLAITGSNAQPFLLNRSSHYINSTEMWNAVLTGKYTFTGSGWGNFMPAMPRTVDIHMIYHDCYAYLQCGLDINKGIEAHRKVDFVVSKAMFMTPQAKYSDIILPITTQWERPGGMDTSNREAIVIWQQVVPPLYEAKSDQEIEMMLMDAMGLDAETKAKAYTLSEKAQFFNQLCTCTYITEAGEQKKIATITEEDLAEWKDCVDELAAIGMQVAPQEGAIALKQLLKNGCFQVERREGDAYSKSYAYAWAGFLADPEANPLATTASGKFEIYCQAKADLLNNMYPGPEVKPYPNYLQPSEGYESTFKDSKIGGEKGEYPYLCYNPHYYRRSHSTLDNLPWLREACPNPVFLAAADAAEKGIVDGDTVLVYNKYGKILRQASVVETMMPGVVGVPHGAWVDLDEATGIDKGGADNTLCGQINDNTPVAGYNNYNCNFEKYTGEALIPDCEKPQAVWEL